MGLLSKVSARKLMESGRNGPASGTVNKKNDSLESRIAHFHRIYNVLNCILFENNGEKNFCHTLQDIVYKTGTVIPLSSGNLLILLRGAVDRELIAHRLSRSLKTRLLLSFEAKNPQSVIKRLGKF